MNKELWWTVETAVTRGVCRYRRSELQTRQLGDLEFASRHAELLKSKAKHSSLCSFLRRMQNSKKRYVWSALLCSAQISYNFHSSVAFGTSLVSHWRFCSHGNAWHVCCVFCSGLTGDTEHVNTLMKQYMCASVYQWRTQPTHIQHYRTYDDNKPIVF